MCLRGQLMVSSRTGKKEGAQSQQGQRGPEPRLVFQKRAAGLRAQGRLSKHRTEPPRMTLLPPPRPPGRTPTLAQP